MGGDDTIASVENLLHHDKVMTDSSLSPEPASQHPGPIPSRLAAITVIVLAVAIGAGWLWGKPLWQYLAALQTEPAPRPLAAAPPVAPIPPAPIPPAPAAAETPRFDIVRVSETGTAVIAGRAAPGAEVAILVDGRPIGRVTADQAGEFVFTPDAALAPGPHAISLAVKPAAGEAVRSESDVLVVVPAAPGGGAVAALAPNGPAGVDMPKLLQAPPAAPAGEASAAPAQIHEPEVHTPAVEVLDYDQAGHLRLSGHAAPGDTLSLAIDGHAAGEAKVAADGHWTMAPAAAVTAGKHRLELVARDADRTVTGKAALPFLREKLAPGSLKPGMIVVQPGQNLWRIAREVYGSGIRYTIIYAANRGHLRSPGAIYPGQTLIVPPAPAAKAPRGRTPASSSTSR